MNPVDVDARDPALLATAIGEERWYAMQSITRSLRSLYLETKVINVTEGAPSGEIGQMVQGMLGYSVGAGLRANWYTLHTTPEFRAITQRLQDQLQGLPGDGGHFGTSERLLYMQTIRRNFGDLVEKFHPGDVIALHDPATAGLCQLVAKSGGCVLWRCHSGSDVQNVYTRRAWAFLEPYVEHAHRIVVNRSTSFHQRTIPAAC